MGDIEIHALPHQDATSWMEIRVLTGSCVLKGMHTLGYIDTADVKLTEQYAKCLLHRAHEVAKLWNFGRCVHMYLSDPFVNVYADGEFCNIDFIVETLKLAKDQQEGHVHRLDFIVDDDFLYNPRSSCSIMKAMWEKRQFSDMVLVCNFREFPCHREVLSSVSPVFERIMINKLREGLEQIVEIRDFKPDVVQAFLEYVYLGDLPDSVSSDIIEGVLCMSDMYDLPALSERCAKALLHAMSDDNVPSILHTLGKLSETNAAARSAFHLAKQKIRCVSSLLETLCMFPSRHVVKAFGTDVDTNPMKVRGSFTEFAGVFFGEVKSCAESFSEAQLISTLHTEGLEHDQNGLAAATSPRGLDLLSLPGSDDLNFVSSEAFVDQSEPPAVIPDEEASLIEEERWATMVEQRIAREATDDQIPEEQSSQSQVVVLTFQKNIRGMSQALINSEFGCKLAAVGLEMQPSWANGATVMVQGLTHDQMMSQSSLPVASLRPWHVVVCEDDEAMVFQALSSFSYRQRPRPRDSQRVTLTFVDMQSTSKDLEEGRLEMDGKASPPDLAIEVQRTFIHFSESVPQSPRTSVTY